MTECPIDPDPQERLSCCMGGGGQRTTVDGQFRPE